MKKTFIFLFSIIFSTQISYGAVVLLDSAWVSGNGDFNVDSTQNGGQCFTPSVTANITSASMFLKKNASPSGDFVFNIYATTGTYGSTCTPTGSALATSSATSSSGLTTSYATTTLTFTGGNSITLTSGTNYALVANYNSTSYVNSVFAGNKTPSFASGNMFYNAGGVSAWSSLGTYDLMFEVYGDTSSGTPAPKTLGFFGYYNKRR